VITANINYSVDTGVKPVAESHGPGNIYYRNTGTHESRAMPINDGRARLHFSIDAGCRNNRASQRNLSPTNNRMTSP